MNQEPKIEIWLERAYPWVFLALSLLVLAGAIVRITASPKPISETLDRETLIYLGVAAALLLLRHIKSFALGEFKLELEQVRKVAEAANTTAQVAQDAVAYGVTAKTSAPTGESPARPGMLDEEAAKIRPGDTYDDPWKNVFGGRNVVNNRRLEATVTPLPASDDWFVVELRVLSTDPANHPLTGSVQLFLHDSFVKDRPIIPVSHTGVASLKLKAWGAFTVGALADGGATRLELDLALMPAAPKRFRMR